MVRFPCTRGYGYVACSRFKTRDGCYLYGKLRRTDFLPVGVEQEDEVLERGYESAESDASDYSGGHEHAHDSDEEIWYDGEDQEDVPGNLLDGFV